VTYESIDDSSLHGVLLGDNTMRIWVVLVTI